MFKKNAPKVETIIKTSEEPRAARLNGFQRLRECCFIVGVLSSILLAVSLFSFSAADPSWSQTAWGGEVNNAGGLIGAWLADTLFFTFGVFAYLMPFLFTLSAWLLFRKKTEGEKGMDPMLWGTRILGFTILLLTSCGLADINFDDIWYFSSGGIIGDVLTNLVLPTLNVLGTTLVLLFLWGAGFTLLTGISWLTIVEWLGEMAISVFDAIANKLRGEKTETLEPELPDYSRPSVALAGAEAVPVVPHMTVAAAEKLREKIEPTEHEYPIYYPQSTGESSREFSKEPSQELSQESSKELPRELLQSSRDVHSENAARATREAVVPQPTMVITPEREPALEAESIYAFEPMEGQPEPAHPLTSTIEEIEAAHPLDSHNEPSIYSNDADPVVEPSLTVEHETADDEIYPESVFMTPEPVIEQDIEFEQLHSTQAFDQPAEEEMDFYPSSSVVDVSETELQREEYQLDNDDLPWAIDEEENKQEETLPTPVASQPLEEYESTSSFESSVSQQSSASLESVISPERERLQEQVESSEPATSNVPMASPSSMAATQVDAVQANTVFEPVMESQQKPAFDETLIEDVEEQDEETDKDAAAFQEIVAAAQAKVVASQNPFLVQQHDNLPVPEEPLPTLELLYHPEHRDNFIDRDALERIARLVESKLADYKITAEVVGIYPGPVITRFELDLAPGVKVSRISGLSTDLARSLSAMAVRVVEVIPGKPYIGLELPNMTRQTVYLSDVIASPQFEQAKSPTTVVLGQDIAGEAVVADLAKMPHVLVAGTTGSGKSVGVNVMILSILYKASPEEVRFIMIDPKMLELSVYEGIPHLLSEVVTDMKDASNALRWCVGEMERRYKLMSVLGVRNIKGFNDKLKMAADAGHPIHDPLWKEGDSMDTEPPLLEKLPYIVVIVDEFADLMMVVGKKVEELIARLAQKARAAGIHLVLATQRPSVDVITGLIKANIPTRVAFTVSTKTDSRTILDQGGAESLLGMGDMLYLPPGSSHTTRVHGAFASDDDVHAVVNNWKARGKPNYIEEITHGDQGPEGLLPGEVAEADEDIDPLFDQVVEHVVHSRRGSVSGVQRRFKIGYNRAARIVEQLEAQGIVSAPGHNGNREVLAPAPPKD